MKIRSLTLAITSFLLSALFIACDDKLNEIGANIQPDDDDILIVMDTLNLFSETVSMNDSVYGRTTIGLLGKFEDPLFGTLKSNYLTEFYCPIDSLVFYEGLEFLGVDSMKMNIIFSRFAGDTLAPMGLSVYKVNTPLKRDYFTNVDPSSFSDMNAMLGQKTYTINQAQKVKSGSVLYRVLSVDLPQRLGEEFYEEWKNGNAFESTDNLRRFFPGVYITTTFGSGALLESEITSLNVYYKYKDQYEKVLITANKDTVKNEEGIPVMQLRDTIYSNIFTILVTPQVITLNSIENTFPNPNTLLTDPEALYVKAPAGVHPQIQFHLHDIVRKMNSYGDAQLSVNSGKLVVKGYTERESEQKYNFGKAPYMLLIDTDSLPDFFLREKLPDNKTSFYAAWDNSTNSYSFTNLAPMIVNYREKINSGKLTKEPTFALIPIQAEFTTNSSSRTLIGVYNYMGPAASIIRKDNKNLRFSYIISKY